MRARSRLATIVLLASHLAAASVPCPTAKAHHHPVPEHAALASAPAHPCRAHAQADAHAEAAPATWFDARCPCGCDTDAPPSGASARIGPALLLAMPGPFGAPGRSPLLAPAARLAELALAPPEPVPLPIA